MMKLLLPFSWVYGFIMLVRNWCYDAGIFKVHHVTVPVISVGNMTAGGTGKTPMVEYLIRYCVSKGKNVAVLSRGYKRTSDGTIAIGAGENNRGNADLIGDEPCQLAKKFPQLTVVVGAKRADSARLAIERYKANVLLLDDGFQHRALARDLNIVMVNEPLKDIPMLPAGLRREPLTGLQRADVIVGKVEYGSALRIESEAVPVFIKQVYGDARLDVNSLTGKRCVVVSGIGNPQRFIKSVELLGLEIQEFMQFPDHYRFSSADVSKIAETAKPHQPDYIITTEKDSVRLLSIPERGTILSTHLYYLAIEMRITSGEAEFLKLIDRIIQ